MKKKKVLVGLSGGIDSAVATMLLQQQGHDVEGVFIHLWSDGGTKGILNKCCSLETQMRAEEVCKKLNIPFHILDLSLPFKRHVVQYFIKAYTLGITPNPCVVCNKEIKFGIIFNLLDKYKADFFATGHYAQIVHKRDGYHLYEGEDKMKDQTYFLYTVPQTKLSKILFPLGNLKKTRVRKMAQQLQISTFNDSYRESQNLCFFPENSPEEFLIKYLPKKYQQSGPIKNLKGKTVGRHKGLFRYTVGQRKGIEIGGQETPLYVVHISMKDNTLYVGQEKDLYSSTCTIVSPTFISGTQLKEMKNLLIKTRYTKNPAKGDITRSGKKCIITFHKPVRAITPGQSAVFYKGEEVIGGGIIISE